MTGDHEIVTDSPREIRKVIERVVESVAKRVTLNIHDRLIAEPSAGGTPIDTTHARASWICSISSPDPRVGGTRKNVDHSISRAGRQKVDTYVLSQGQLFISNSTSYILLLNYGSSPQARPGFVDAAVAQGVSDLENGLSDL